MGLLGGLFWDIIWDMWDYQWDYLWTISGTYGTMRGAVWTTLGVCGTAHGWDYRWD